MNIDKLRLQLEEQSKEVLINKLIGIYCQIDSLGHGDVHKCLSYLPNLDTQEYKDCHGKMYESVNNAFDLCFNIVENQIKSR